MVLVGSRLEGFFRGVAGVKFHTRYLAMSLLLVLGLSGCVHIEVLQARQEAEQLYKEGRTKEIVALVEKMIVRVEDSLGPDHWYLGEGYDVLARLHAYVYNDWDLARDYFEKALAVRKKALGPEHPDTLETVNFMGYLHQVRGDLETAEAHFQKALRLRTKVLGADHIDTADSQVYLGGLHMLQGRYADAEKLLQAAAPNEAREISGRHPTPAEAYRLLGTLYYSLGDLERAEKNARTSLEILEEVFAPDHPEIAGSYNALALIAYRRRDFDEAKTLAEQVLRIRENKFGRRHGFTGDSLLFLSRIEQARGQPEQSRRYQQEAIETYQKLLGPDNYRTLSGKLALAWSYAGAGQLDTAKALSEEILVSPRLHLTKELEWNTLLLYSVVLGAGGQRDAAILFGKRAVNIVQGLRAGITSMDDALQKLYVQKRDTAFRTLASLLVEEGRLPEAQRVVKMIKEEEHFNYVRRDAARGSVRESKASYTASEQSGMTRYEEIGGRLAAIASEYDTLLRKKKAGLVKVDPARLKQLREDLRVAKRAFRAFLANLIKEVEKGSAKRAMEIGEKNLKDLKALQGTLRTLGDGTVLIHYLITDRKLHIIVTTGRVQIVRTVPVDRSTLNRRVSELAEDFADPYANPIPDAQAIYDLILAPIADDLRQANAKTLMFSLDGVLRYLPMAALYDGERFLVEKYEVVLFTEAAKSKLTAAPPKDWRMAGLGLTQAVEGFAALPAVADELNAIVRTGSADRDGVMPGVIYLDKNFSQDAIESALDEEYPVLHVASHFVFQPGTERDSYLLLGDGGRLSLAQVLDNDLDFNSVALLTLSACQTALGSAGADGREIESFGWLAQRQGAKAVLATLWPVADKSTAAFMSTMYGYLQTGTLSKAAAMRKTMIEFIRSDAYGKPVFWAPFILMGNWR
ncbi:MAG: CHAT domain-containing protein [Alphaproteobacteria bacterium]|nr:CHAT domain-containing protein [Alphaproteobacteria bacterium]